MTISEPLALDYFSGGVPTGDFFRMTLEDLMEISKADSKDHPGINRLQELCLIGAVAYFEAFCKDQFAAVLNLEPSLVSNLKAAGQDVSLDARHVVLYGEEFDRRIGFILADKYDFGSAKKVNALFNALLNITPFNRTEAATFDALLRDRNLLVHHGGTFTLAYLEQNGRPIETAKTNAFFDSRVVGKREVLATLTFLGEIAAKIIRGSHRALISYLTSRGISYSGERQKALCYLGDFDLTRTEDPD